MNKDKQIIKSLGKARRKARTRSKIFGTAKHPRLNVTKTLNHVFLQLIDDEAGKTLESLHSKSLKTKGTKSEVAKIAGVEFAKKISGKYKTCIFDRGASRYHGRVKAVAEGLREGGLIF